MRWFQTEPAKCLLLVLITVAAYLPTFQNGFVDYDDPIYVKSNLHVAAGLTGSSLLYAWTTFDSGNWIPVTWMSYLLDSSLFGINATAFHATNLLLHTANVLLLYCLLRRLTGAIGKSFIVAALFAVHPLHVESVAWISERKDVLSTFWMLLALLAYARYAGNPGRWRFLLVTLCMVLGLLSKSMLVTLPILMLLIDWWPLRRVAAEDALEDQSPDDPRRFWATLILEKGPWFLLSFLFGIVTICAQGSGTSAYTAPDRLPMAVRFGNALHAYVWYLTKTFVPIGLSVFYPHPLGSLSWMRVAGAVVILASISLFVIVRGRQRPHLIFGWLWFLIALLPVIGVLQVGSQAQADRYSYVPHVGLFVLIVWEAEHWLQRFSSPRQIAISITTVVVVASLFLTFRQVSYWRNTESLFSHALAVDSKNYLAHYQLGVFQMRHENPESAIEHFQSVLAIRANHTDALNNLGWVYQQRSEWKLAEDCYQRAVRADPAQKRAINNLNRLKQQIRQLQPNGDRPDDRMD